VAKERFGSRRVFRKNLAQITKTYPGKLAGRVLSFSARLMQNPFLSELSTGQQLAYYFTRIANGC